MRLVGASNSYIRGPFLFEGLFYGLCGALISSLILFLALAVLQPKIASFFRLQLEGVGYFGSDFWKLVLIQMATGVILGIISSMIAMKKYLKV